MGKSRVILWFVGAVVAIAVVLVGIVAVGVGGEASDLNSYLNNAVSSHEALAKVRQKLLDTGYSLPAGGDSAQLSGSGPHHSALLYSTWLTVKVEFDSDLKANAFQIQRESAWL